MDLSRSLADSLCGRLNDVDQASLVAICGWADTGKSTLAGRLRAVLAEAGVSAESVSTDDFLLDRAQRYAMGINGYDPRSLDIAGLVAALGCFLSQQPFSVHPYDNRSGTKRSVARTVPPARVLVVEGIHSLHPSIASEPASAADVEAMVAIRIEAMRESLERIGRFDPDRARERLRSGFSPDHTRHILVDGERVGFVVTTPNEQHLLLDHLYIRPGHQGRGTGAQVLQWVFAQAESLCLPVKVGALRQSDSNRFYVRHGFQLIEQGEFDNHYLRPPAASR